MEPNVLVRRFDPLEIVEGDKNESAFAVDSDAIFAAFFDHDLESLPARSRSLFASADSGAVEGLLEALVIEWLEQVVDGVELKGVDGVVIVSSGEDNERPLVFGNGRDHVETRRPRHADVKDQQVRPLLHRLCERVFTVLAARHELEARVGLYEGLEDGAGVGLVVGHEHAEGCIVHG